MRGVLFGSLLKHNEVDLQNKVKYCPGFAALQRYMVGKYI